jgi:HK97 family phage major capsid protein
MTTTTYDYKRYAELKRQRDTITANCKSITAAAKAQGRDLTKVEVDAVEAGLSRLDTEIDPELKAQGAAMVAAVMRKTSDTGADGVQYLSLRTPGLKSELLARFGAAIGTPGFKSMIESGDPYTTIPLDPQVYVEGSAPTSLVEILPAQTQSVVYRYLRQTSRTNNAAPVAPGALKPTSLYGLTPVDGRLHVVAHLSEAMDKYQLQDNTSLESFVRLEMVTGLHQAVEDQLVNGDGTDENLTGLAHTSGIQTQAYVTSPVLTARAAITKVEVLSFAPYYFVLNPIDWESIETSTLTAGQYVLNAEGTRNGLPVDSATRRLWGVPVTVSTAVTAGTGYLLSNGVAMLATDGSIQVERSEAGGDTWEHNQVRLRVEGRFDLAVTRPMGVVQIGLTAA